MSTEKFPMNGPQTYGARYRYTYRKFGSPNGGPHGIIPVLRMASTDSSPSSTVYHPSKTNNVETAIKE